MQLQDKRLMLFLQPGKMYSFSTAQCFIARETTVQGVTQGGVMVDLLLWVVMPEVILFVPVLSQLDALFKNPPGCAVSQSITTT